MSQCRTKLREIACVDDIGGFKPAAPRLIGRVAHSSALRGAVCVGRQHELCAHLFCELAVPLVEIEPIGLVVDVEGAAEEYVREYRAADHS